MNTKIINKLFVAVCLFSFVPRLIFASSVSFELQKNTVAPDTVFLVRVLLNTRGEIAMNAIEGKISFPGDLLELKEIRDGNSDVNFWIEKPKEAVTGSVIFSGITAGGFSRENNFLFSMVFRAKQKGEGLFTFEDIRALQNDGVGTEVTVSDSSLTFSISDMVLVSGTDSLDIEDIDPPETFKPYIGVDSNIYNGKSFVVFSTQDKGSGIDHYEVKEGYFGTFVTAESPYLLENQSSSKVYVKAVDKKGNEYIVAIESRKSTLLYPIGLIIAILLLVYIFIHKKRCLRSIKK